MIYGGTVSTSHEINIPQEQLDDLRDRLVKTRWPERETVSDWSQGVPLDYVRELCDYWATGYDWRVVERRINALPQLRMEVDGLGFHVIHARSPHPDALPIVLTHGWPGSLVEFLKVIGPLTDPTAYGRDAADAFHVVVPSLPGYGFSDKPTTTGWGVQRTAAAWAEIMAQLGYERYGAVGGDWGASVTTQLGAHDTGHLAGILLTPALAVPDRSTFDDLSPLEAATMAELRDRTGGGYSAEQSTRPQTVGYGLVDSPAGTAAWILEKFAAWTDSGGRPETVISRDELIDNLMLYWLPATGASSARMYWQSFSYIHEWFSGKTTEVISVPMGCASFPGEPIRPSRRWAERQFSDIRYWSEPARGGHFAAFEQPELYTDEVAAFFRLVR
jgi:pimeloyl-ACP methyl ester carboxylesterase